MKIHLNIIPFLVSIKFYLLVEQFFLYMRFSSVRKYTPTNSHSTSSINFHSGIQSLHSNYSFSSTESVPRIEKGISTFANVDRRFHTSFEGPAISASSRSAECDFQRVLHLRDFIYKHSFLLQISFSLLR